MTTRRSIIPIENIVFTEIKCTEKVYKSKIVYHYSVRFYMTHWFVTSINESDIETTSFISPSREKTVFYKSVLLSQIEDFKENNKTS